MVRKYTIPTAFTEELIYRNYTGDMSMLNAILGGALAQEPDATGPLRGPLTSWMYYWGQPKATKAEAMEMLGVAPPTYAAQLQAGDPNPFFGFVDSLNQSGNNIVRGPGYSTLTPTNDDDLDWIDVGRMVMLVAAGGDAEGIPVYFVIDDVTAVCPFAPTDLVDEEGEPIPPETWETWEIQGGGTDGYMPKQINGTWYRCSNVMSRDGNHLKASEWVPLMLAGIVTVISVEDFQQLQPIEE